MAEGIPAADKIREGDSLVADKHPLDNLLADNLKNHHQNPKSTQKNIQIYNRTPQTPLFQLQNSKPPKHQKETQ